MSDVDVGNGQAIGVTPEAAGGSRSPFAELDEVCHGAVRRAWSEMERVVDEGTPGRLKILVEKHREVLDSIAIEGDAPTDPDERTSRIAEYRKAVDAELLEVLVASLGSETSGARIADVMSAAIQETIERAKELPPTVEDEWLPDALAPKPSDSAGRKAGKSIARVISAARKSGESRTAPFRPVALSHIASEVVPNEDEALREALLAWARWARDLEAAWTKWASVALPELARAAERDREDVEEGWIDLREALLEFQAALEALSNTSPLADSVSAANARLGLSAGVLQAEYAVAGSFLLKEPQVETPFPGLSKSRRLQGSFERWETAITDRYRLYSSLLDVLSGADGVSARLVSTLREQCLPPAEAFPAAARSLEALLDGISGRDADALEALEKRVRRELEPVVEIVPPQDQVERAITKASNATVDALGALVRQPPATVELRADPARLPSPRKVDLRPVPVQELALQSFDALRIERIRAAANSVLDGVEAVRDRLNGLQDVFGFAAEAARKELEEAEPDADTRATDLVSEAIRSMAESLRHEVVQLDTIVEGPQNRLTDEISAGSLGLMDRVAAGGVQAQLLAARSRFADLRAQVNERWGPPVDRFAKKVMIRWVRLRRLLTRGLNRGSEIVGGTTGERGASTRSVKRLADVKAMTSELPLVYQRLFTFEPLTDSALLSGRSSEMADAMRRWENWRVDDGVPLIVEGRQGCGITSFMNVLAANLAADGNGLKQIALPDRLMSEQAIASLLAESLEVAPCNTLDEVSAAVFAAREGAVPAIVTLDNLEHLFLRIPGGTDLIERLLTLMAETGPRIFWIGGISSSAWQLVSAGEPTAVSQVGVLHLAPLEGEALREAILVRHRRSGLPLTFEEPEDGRRLLKRKLIRARDGSSKQEILRTDFFEQLQRTSGGHMRLAIFQWLTAIDFEAGDGVRVDAPEKPNFSLLESLALTQSFTLKAFLEHRTLTLDEHDRIFRLPRHESFQIFESLGNRHLIAPVRSQNNGQAHGSAIVEDLRYEVSPVLAGAVITHLTGRNIVH